jgi:hypothetical protein
MKLPHWAQLTLGLAVIIITWVMQKQASGDLTLPAIVMTVLVTIKTAIGLLTDGIPTALAAKRARLAAMRAGGLAIFLLAFVGCSGCSGSQPSQAVNAGVDLAVCVIVTVSADIAANVSWNQCVADAVSKCGADAGQVVSIYTAHQAAEVREGLRPAIPGVVTDAGSVSQ